MDSLLTMPWFVLLGHLCLFTTILAINRPVYKIVLAQKGYAQFLQYDVETPPLREFTFCTWLRVYDLSNDQTIFTYVANSNNRIMRLWLERGGRNFKLSINDRIKTTFAIEIVKDVWRHVCLSYQSDYGAWAFYVDSRLAACEAAQSLYGYVLPGAGSVIIGYGTDENGMANGFEGEIFGANMILTSTIEKNVTNRKNPEFEQKNFHKNKVRDNGKSLNYIVLSNLQTDEVQNNFEKTRTFNNATKSFIKFQTPHSYLEHDVGIDILATTNPNSNDKEVLDITLNDTPGLNDKDNLYFWNIISPTGSMNLHSSKNTSHFEQPSSSTRVLPTIATFETPPAPPSTYSDSPDENLTKTQSFYNIKDSTPEILKMKPTKVSNEISEIETPPPVNTNTNVYGQWTSSKFAGTVLNYLKSINFNNRGKHTRKIPATIPLMKYSDAHPYGSELTINKLRPPSQFNRRNILEKRYDTMKRDPQINLQILEDDLRSNIIKKHAQTKPKIVEITNRGEGKKDTEHRFYRNANYDDLYEIDSMEKMYHQPRPFTLASNKKKIIKDFSGPNIPNQKYKSVLPFLKALEYTIDSLNPDQTATTNDDMYSKSIKGNKWHNVKSYSNDYTPRKINMDPHEHKDETIKRHPTIRLKYKPEDRKIVEDEDPSILKGRKLAMEVSNQSDTNIDTVSIFKYNHGYIANSEKQNHNIAHKNSKRNMNFKNFNKQIKIGNALNEHSYLGKGEFQKEQSFIGGDESIPDINRYRSDIDNENVIVPSSLGPRICKNVELYDRVLYVQQDESIDMTHILSPVRAKNIAIEFILQNYKKCSLKDSKLEVHSKLFIDWSKTPVRLFGGAYPRTTTDLCGFF